MTTRSPCARPGSFQRDQCRFKSNSLEDSDQGRRLAAVRVIVTVTLGHG